MSCSRDTFLLRGLATGLHVWIHTTNKIRAPSFCHPAGSKKLLGKSAAQNREVAVLEDQSRRTTSCFNWATESILSEAEVRKPGVSFHPKRHMMTGAKGLKAPDVADVPSSMHRCSVSDYSVLHSNVEHKSRGLNVEYGVLHTNYSDRNCNILVANETADMNYHPTPILRFFRKPGPKKKINICSGQSFSYMGNG